ncbi:MAG: hypothetical protein ACM3ML_22230 [Micromonosporaceae bacterium]
MQRAYLDNAAGAPPVTAWANRLAGRTFRDATVADVFTFSNGLIVRMRAYADPAQALAT